MTVASSDAIFGFGCQTAKGTLATTWYRHKAVRANVGFQQAVEQFPPEIGAGFHPTGAYKAMAFGAGQAVLNMRLKEVIGWLLCGAIGAESSIESATPESGMYRHHIAPPTAASGMKWMSLRTYTPGADADSEIGQIIKDARSLGFQLDVAAGGLATATFPFIGREPKLMEEIDTGDTYAWTWHAATEDYRSVPIASSTSTAFKIDGVSQVATSVRVTLANAYTAPQEELIVGSPYPDDFILRTQALSFDWIYKWQDATLYKALLTGEETADGSGYISWSTVPDVGSADLILVSPGNVTGRESPYRLRIYAPECVWSAAGPPELVGGGWLSLRMTGVAQEVDVAAGPTFHAELDNEEANYTWPS